MVKGNGIMYSLLLMYMIGQRWRAGHPVRKTGMHKALPYQTCDVTQKECLLCYRCNAKSASLALHGDNWIPDKMVITQSLEIGRSSPYCILGSSLVSQKQNLCAAIIAYTVSEL